VSLMGKMAGIFGTAVACLGIVADVVGVILDGINAVAAFSKGGTWNDIDGALDVAEGVATLAVIASACLLGLTNPVTAIFSVIMLGVCLIAWLSYLFKPKPLTGPQLVADALSHMSSSLCTYSPPAVGCFPATSQVSVGNATLPISQLQLGMPVSTVTPAGALASSPVHFFGHKDPVSLAVFHRVVTASGHSVSLTGDHLLPTAAASATLWSARTFKRARSIEEGEYLWVKGSAGSLELSQVTGLSTYTAQGLFNPYSEDGATLVNDVVTSDHSEWVFDFLVGDENAHVLPRLYAPLLQTALAYLYAAAPTLVENISECFYSSQAAGASWQDARCAGSTVASWVWGSVLSVEGSF